MYERVGGSEGIRKLVDTFYQRVLTDPLLSPFFEETPMEKLQAMQHEFFCAALGGDVDYSGVDLSYAHQGRGIERKHFAAFVEHLFATLEEDCDCTSEDTRLIIARVNTYADDIMSDGVSIGG